MRSKTSVSHVRRRDAYVAHLRTLRLYGCRRWLRLGVLVAAEQLGLGDKAVDRAWRFQPSSWSQRLHREEDSMHPGFGFERLEAPPASAAVGAVDTTPDDQCSAPQVPRMPTGGPRSGERLDAGGNVSAKVREGEAKLEEETEHILEHDGSRKRVRREPMPLGKHAQFIRQRPTELGPVISSSTNLPYS